MTPLIIQNGESTAEAARQATLAAASASAAAASAVTASASATSIEERARIERWLKNANGLGPRTMASPPTVTSGTTKTLPQLWYAALGNASYRLASSPRGGFFSSFRSIPTTNGLAMTAGLSITSNTGSTPNAYGLLQTSFLHEGSAIEIILQSTTGMVIRVDDEYVNFTPTVISNTLTFVKLAFGSSKMRRIDVIGMQLNFVGVATGWTDTLLPAPRRGPPTVVLTDSFGQADVQSWPSYLSDVMGWDDVWAAGVGGTGYVATANGAAKKFRDRIATDVIPFAPEIVIISGSGNDSSHSAATVQSEAQACVEQILTALPDCLVIGGFNASGGVETMIPAQLDAMDAAKAGVLAGGGVWLNPIEMPITFDGAAPATTVAFATAANRPGSGATPDVITPSTQGITGQTNVSPATNGLPFAGAVVEIGTGATRERIRVTTFGQTSGVIAYGFDGTARFAHSVGEPMVMKGPSYMTGRGNVGAPTGFGNADLFVSADDVHPSPEGSRAMARAKGGLIRNYLASLLA